LRFRAKSFFDGDLLFDGHVFEFARFEDFAALFALDELQVLFASYDLNARVLTRIHDFSLWLVD
jgi:hypothetical protein